MSKGIKIANDGINALTNQNPENFSIFVDGSDDHIIVKEKVRGTESVAIGATDDIAHGLSYVPLSNVYVESDTGEYTWVNGLNIYIDYRYNIDDTEIHFTNLDSAARTFTYLIYHDQL